MTSAAGSWGATPHGLGPQIDEFRPSPWPYGMRRPPSRADIFLISLGSLILLSLVHLSMGGWRALLNPVCLLALLFPPVLTLLLPLLIRRGPPDLVVRAFAGGLVCRRGVREVVVRWDDVTETELMPLPNGTATVLQLRLRDGRKIDLDATLERREVLQLLVEAETFARLWPPLLERFLAGERLVFGQLRADRRGLTVEGYGFEVLPWHHLDRVDLEGKGHIIRVRREGALLTWFRESIPNQHLFLALVDHVHKHGPPPDAALS